MGALYTKTNICFLYKQQVCIFHVMPQLSAACLAFLCKVYNSPDCTACQGKKHTDQITPKLFGACYVVRSGFYISKPDCLQEVCFIFLL